MIKSVHRQVQSNASPAPQRRTMLVKCGVWVCLILSTSLISCNTNDSVTQPPPATDGNEFSGKALVLDQVSSPVFEELSSTFDETAYDGSQDVGDYDLIVFDGDAYSPARIRDEQVVADAITQGKWVLAFDLTGEHKQTGFGDKVPFISLTDSPGHLLRRDRDQNNRVHYSMLEYAPEVTMAGDVSGGLGAQATQDREITPLKTQAFVSELRAKLAEPIVRLQQAPTPPDAPADLIYMTASYTVPAPWTAGNAGKRNGSQSGSFSTTYDFYVFLDNQQANANGSFQWLVVSAHVQANPTAGTGNFIRMDGDEKAWWQDRIKISMEIGSDAATSFTTQHTEPATANNQTSLTSGSSFSIGFTGSNDGGGANASYTYSNSQTTNISDWQVTNDSAPTSTLAAWDFRSQLLDADQPYVCPLNSNFDTCNGFKKYSWYPKDPTELSVNEADFYAEAAWQTSGVLTDTVTLDLNTEQHIADIWCKNDVGEVCRFWFDTDNPTGEQHLQAMTTINYQVNMGAVIPPEIQSVTFSQDPAAAGDTVTGTVTFDSPLQLPATISLKSDSGNATVDDSVSANIGDTSVDFQILTNANGLGSGASTTATISAFYAGYEQQAQLTVQN